MTIDETKNVLKKEFARFDIELADEHPTELFFKFGVDRIFKLNAEAIESFRSVRTSDVVFENKPTETGIISCDYREQLVQFLNPIRSRFLPPRDINIMFGKENMDSPYVQIGQCSKEFIWTNLFNEAFFDIVIERLMFKVRRSEQEDFFDSISKPMTIKVYNLDSQSIDSALKKSSDFIDSCLFSYTSLKDNPIGLLEEWPRRKRSLERKFEFSERHKGNEFNLPNVKFNQHLIRFYQLAASTDIESYKFLSYYHILEYHFVLISDQLLYSKLSRRINDLRFKTNPTNLDKIIQDVNAHRSETDETEMLKNVLNKLIIEDELTDFIKKYEAFLGSNLYTKKKTIFDTEISGTNLNSGHVIGVIAKRIKTIRNALVHSSDRHERNSRFVPYSSNASDLIKQEIPLLKFLAEKVIIGTAQ